MLSYSHITLKKRGGRKKGQKVNKVKAEPYVKTEVMDSHRTHEVYGLRQVVKRKRFTDEISEPSDLDLGSHHLWKYDNEMCLNSIEMTTFSIGISSADLVVTKHRGLKLDGAIGQGEICNSLKSEKKI